MAEPFKEWINTDAIGRLADGLSTARPRWSPAPFLAAATDGLQPLELKDRIRHVAAALRAHLAPDYPAAIAHILDALPPALDGADGVTESFELWPFCQYVESYGLEHLELSLTAMHALTQRFSCEFAVRPFLLRYPEPVLERLTTWSTDPSTHVRRLVSEGARPRLPWGIRLQPFVADPAPVLPLLEALKDDPELYVRRSVANNLNDIAKDHPALVVAIAQRWSEGASAEREKLVRHALRTLIKRGDPGALAVLGFGPPEVDLGGFTLETEAVTLGDALAFNVTLRSTAAGSQKLLIDYAVHHQRKNGKLSPKVFKWTTREIAAGEALTLSRRHPIRPITTRRYYPGAHKVELLVNGASLGVLDFTLRT